MIIASVNFFYSAKHFFDINVYWGEVKNMCYGSIKSKKYNQKSIFLSVFGS